MKALQSHRWVAVAACGVPLLFGHISLAEDTDIFYGENATTAEARPNILMVIDTSGSMDDHVVTQPIYDPNRAYAGSCNADRIYYSTGTTPPTCSTNNWFNATALVCQDARNDFASTTGFFVGRAQRNRPDNGNWVNLSTSARDHIVECADDWGIHGANAASTLRYPQNSTSNPFRSNTSGAINWSGRQSYRMYNANYLNWYHDNRLSTLSKMEIVKSVSQSLVDSISGVNLGLMRFSNNDADNGTENLRAQGGMVLHEIADVATSRQSIRDTIETFLPRGFTPLSEVMYEAGLYFRGEEWEFGENARGYNEEALPSVPASRTTADTNRYKTPIQYSCQKNYVVYLTDGLPTADTGANTLIGNLIGHGCDVSAGISGNGQCFDDMSEFLFQNDNSPLEGEQNVTTYTIGFDADFPLLASTAERGGGSYYTANDTGTLVNALTTIVTEISDTAATFSAPAVSVNAFNRSQNLNDLFVTVFRPSNTVHWAGNLKRYRLNPTSGEIEDKNDRAAVNPATGFFRDSAQDIWSATVDGNNVTEGGAANRIPLPAQRNVYTYYPGSPSTLLTNGANEFIDTNTYLTAARLSIEDPGDPTPAELIQWARGAVVRDDGTVDPSAARFEMGDPLHSKPATVVYSAEDADNPLADAVVFVATNDGYLHAIDADSGVELWAFIPSEMWGRLHLLKNNAQASSKSYGIDGNLTVVKDNGDDQVDESDDKVYLYFGMRRGGDFYYALDITDKDSPRFLWRLTPTELPGLGQSWSAPAPLRVRLQGVERKALVFGGGYETDQDPSDTTGLTSHSTDTVGNRIFMVDAVSGALLWSAGPASPASLQVSKMRYSIPSDIRVLDMNNDRFADRMYVGDMGGQLWRFDINNGPATAANLVTGGVIASLGNAHETTHPASSLRRFYYAPSISMFREGNMPFLSVGIGSGYREGPLNTETDDRLYSVRDFNVFNRLTQTQYNALTVVNDDDTNLIDVTDGAQPSTSQKGWKYRLPRDGEKTVAEARTFNFQLFFTSYTPNEGTTVDPCLPQAGTNTLYILDMVTGAVLTRRETVGDLGSEVVILFPPTPDPCDPGDPDCVPEKPPVCEEGDPNCETPPCNPSDPDCEIPPPPGCLPGQPCGAACIWELGSCPADLSNPGVRTFWRQQDVDLN